MRAVPSTELLVLAAKSNYQGHLGEQPAIAANPRSPIAPSRLMLVLPVCVGPLTTDARAAERECDHPGGSTVVGLAAMMSPLFRC
jgi:hypothetical protein